MESELNVLDCFYLAHWNHIIPIKAVRLLSAEPGQYLEKLDRQPDLLSGIAGITGQSQMAASQGNKPDSLGQMNCSAQRQKQRWL